MRTLFFTGPPPYVGGYEDFYRLRLLRFRCKGKLEIVRHGTACRSLC